MILTKIPFSLIAEWTCFLVSILLFKSVFASFWKWFIPFLGTTASIETFCYVASKTASSPVNNWWLYNRYYVLYIAFHLFIYSKIIISPAKRKILLLCSVLLGATYLFDFFTVGYSIYFSTTMTVFGGVVISLSILYFYGLFTQETYRDILEEPSFWFVAGCLIFFATMTGLNALFSEIVAVSKANKFPIRYVIVNFLNLIMYGCWIKSFLCLKKNQIYFQ